MLPRIAITRTWSDKDVAQLTFEVCDGVSGFANEAYASLDGRCGIVPLSDAEAGARLKTCGTYIVNFASFVVKASERPSR